MAQNDKTATALLAAVVCPFHHHPNKPPHCVALAAVRAA